MAKGRKPIPAEIREKMGNPGKRPIPKAPTETVPVISEIAPELLDDKAAQAAWAELYPMLDGLNFLRETDKPLLARYCAALSEWVRVRQALIDEGHTYETSSPHNELMKRVNPLHNIRMDLEKLLIKYETELGLTPLSRQNLLNKIVLNGGNVEDMGKRDLLARNDDGAGAFGFALSRGKPH